MLEGSVDIVVDRCHPIQPFFSGRACGGFLRDVDRPGVEPIQTSERTVTMGGRCGVMSEFRQWQPSYPGPLSVVAEYSQVLLERLNCSFAEAVRLRVVCCRES